MTERPHPPTGTAGLRVPRQDVVLTYVLLAGGGAVAGLLLHLARDWLLSLAFVPWRGAIETIDRVVDGWGGWGPVALVAGGAVLGALAAADDLGKEPRIDVTRDEVVVTQRTSRRAYPRADVREALHDDKALVLLASNGTELARVRTAVPAAVLAEALRGAGYSWRDAAPAGPPSAARPPGSATLGG
ncbi:YqeB family protein [Cellulomonas hominis]|uniref:YqeB family protein n=1 Tax=Cellulomonas hominis TaxID=156981 RepID=UPI001B9436CA|nr:hypothetical protein [Cellulomonas hominis]VTR77811.1 hypothetical protein CHMI_02583 [Cellulomonas hominis]